MDLLETEVKFYVKINTLLSQDKTDGPLNL
jgi:hypothetical protein